MTMKQKQWRLYCLGYYGGEIDGIWGTRSKAATVSFQKCNALDADGIFAAQTDGKSTEIIRAIQKVITDGKIAIDGLAGVNTRAEIKEKSSAEDGDSWSSIQYFSRKELKGVGFVSSGLRCPQQNTNVCGVANSWN